MADKPKISVRDILLTQRGLAFVSTAGVSAQYAVRAVELELAELGYVISKRLQERLCRCSNEGLTAFRAETINALQEHLGVQKHEPLFRQFPQGIPNDTDDLWWKKVLVHFLQAEDQPCLFCGRTGTTHVLNPCKHVVCDYCFDGSNYSACPTCEHHVDRSSPFFKAEPDHQPGKESVDFQRLDLGGDETKAVKELFLRLCERKQALSETDRTTLAAIAREYKTQILAWLPATIPVRENVAIVFGTLFQECPSAEVLPIAKRYLLTATDVLRFLAVYSGCDGSLLQETIHKQVGVQEKTSRFWSKVAKFFGDNTPPARIHTVTVSLRVNRFKVAKLSRSLRRALLEILNQLPREALFEDMLRHRSYWVWAGEFLHPGEYAKRYPRVAEAFQIVRKKNEAGVPAPKFQTWYSRIESAAKNRDIESLAATLSERPGEFARRIDFALRIAQGQSAHLELITQCFLALLPKMATPVLLTLSAHLPKRIERAKIRVYWPKARVAMGVSAPDQRQLLTWQGIQQLVQAVRGELLERFAKKPRFTQGIVDTELAAIPVPFNERTASPSAVTLPRGAAVQVELQKTIRLFMHWCEPEKHGHATDLDLSVALYDQNWKYLDVCSYYQLEIRKQGRVVAQSAGDLRDAPWPDGATEFVDLHRDAAISQGARYAVMVVNNYGGMPFSQLERGFAGLMLRDDPLSQHFDPRTVKLKFAISGENGIFMPCVLDLQEQKLHWLDVQSKGQLAMNNVSTSNNAITKICPELITYFQSGTRPSLYDLALLHTAARCQQVTLFGKEKHYFQRRPNESIPAFYERLLAGTQTDPASPANPNAEPVMALLFRGNLELPEQSLVYALFREQVIPTLAASDLLS